MILLIIFAFLGGIVTVLSPCILPILPIVLSSTIGKTIDKSRPIGVVIGFVLSFTFFTLFLSSLVGLIGISADSLRLLSVIVIGVFGASLLIPQFQVLTERLFSRFSGIASSNTQRKGFWGGILIGLSVGLLWTPCVGPILASVISLAITGTVTFNAFLITFAYALGTAIPMFLIMIGGQRALSRVPWLLSNLSKIQKIFGIIMILTAVGIYFNIDRKFQTFILNTFPQYGIGLTSLEDNDLIRKELDKQSGEKIEDGDMGKPMFDLVDPKGVRAPEIIPGGEWFNTDPLSLKGLRGKVVVIDFWTYTCINCQRTFPYLRDWHEKYSDKGLVILGVHSPEFEFEKNEENVRQAIEDFDLKYPIVQDNDFATWRAYKNRYWPAKYIVDKEGHVRYTHFGEGAYDETERVIQELLKETGESLDSSSINNPTYSNYSKTHETYLGYLRIDNFASNERIQKDKIAAYTPPGRLNDNSVAFQGEWFVADEYSNPQKGAKLYINFESKEVFLVMRPKSGSSKVKVYVDDKVQYFGEHNENGLVIVDSDSLYKIVNLDEPGRHILRLEFEDNNTEVFAFTFG